MKDLRDIRDGANPLDKPTFLAKLEEDLVGNQFNEHHLVAKLKNPQEFGNVKRSFVQELMANIERRCVCIKIK